MLPLLISSSSTPNGSIKAMIIIPLPINKLKTHLTVKGKQVQTAAVVRNGRADGYKQMVGNFTITRKYRGLLICKNY